MFSVTGLEFSFTQAPESMKSVLQAFWMVRLLLVYDFVTLRYVFQLTVACGDLIVTIVVSSAVLQNQAMEFLVFAIMMFIDIIIFLMLAMRYRPVEAQNPKIIITSL
jgi:solute carrier family 15 (oligopeptide transporter), member 1